MPPPLSDPAPIPAPTPAGTGARVAYLVTHPIQYQAPLLAAIAREPDIDLKVFFCTDVTARGFHDPEFGARVEWRHGLLDGYASETLPALAAADRVGAWTPINHGLVHRLAAGGFDALWVHGYGRPFNLAAIATARRLGLRVLVRDEATAISRPRGRVKRALKRHFFDWLAWRVDHFLAIGSLNRAYYLGQGVPAGKIGSMPYCIDNATFAAEAPDRDTARAEVRSRWSVAADRPIVLAVGKLIARKAPTLLLDALSLMPVERRPTVIFAGDGALAGEVRRRLEAMDGPRGVVTGFVPQDALPTLYAAADLLVLPSMAESWGLVVNEAMACGLPVLASDRVGAAADLVIEDETGWTFRFGDPSALAARLDAALADPDRLARMGTAARRQVDRFGIPAAVTGLRDALGLPRRPS